MIDDGTHDDPSERSNRRWQFTLKGALLLMLLATAFFAGLRRRLWLQTEENLAKSYPEGAGVKVDFMLNSLPPKVAEAYRSRFSNRRLWKIETKGRTPGTIYYLTVFNHRSASSHGGIENGMSYSVLQNYLLVINEDGSVVSESQHSIDAARVPSAARRSFEKWRKDYPRGDGFVEWHTFQRPGYPRIFVGRVELNSIHAYEATLNAKGQIIEHDVDLSD